MALRETLYQPAQQNSPVNIYNQTSPYSPYQTQFNSGTTPVYTTILLAPDIAPNIQPQWPSQFTDMAFFMSLKKRAVKSLEYNWLEEPWIINPIFIRAGVGATAQVANTVGVQVVPITDATIPFVNIGDKISYNGIAQGVVASKVSTLGAATITVNTMEGAGLPALTTADQLQNHGPITADGFSTIYTQTMPEVITYNNWLEMGGAYAQRWDHIQRQQFKNSGTTDYLERAVASTYTRLMVNLQARLLMSTKGRTLMPDGTSYTTTTSGLLEQQTNAGVVTQNVSTNQFIDALRGVVFDTSLSTGGTKVVLATRELLSLIGQSVKADKVRYSPGDTSWNMDIYEYDFYGHKTILVPMDQWKDVGTYGPNMQKQALILNKEDLYINYMEGIPMISRQHTLLNENNGEPTNTFAFDLVWYKTLFGFEMHKAYATGRIQVN